MGEARLPPFLCPWWPHVATNVCALVASCMLVSLSARAEILESLVCHKGVEDLVSHEVPSAIDQDCPRNAAARMVMGLGLPTRTARMRARQRGTERGKWYREVFGACSCPVLSAFVRLRAGFLNLWAGSGKFCHRLLCELLMYGGGCKTR